MKGKIFAVIFLLNFVFSLNLYAQWAKTYGTGEDEQAYSIQQTYDGGYIVAGKTGSAVYDGPSLISPGQDIWIIKLSSNGIIEWQKIFGDAATDEVYFIKQTNDGGFIFGGRIARNQAHGRISIIKLFPNGDIEWQKLYGSEDFLDNRAHSLQLTYDGGYIVTGQYYNQSTRSYDILILKLFPDGSVEWSKTYRGSTRDFPYRVQQTIDGSYIVAGQTYIYGAGGIDIWILKLTSDGMIEWQKTYGGTENEITHSILRTSDGGYIAAGLTYSLGAGSSDCLILKINSVGDIEWQKAFKGNHADAAYSIQQTVDGGYIVAGETSSFGAGRYDFWILKLNILGDLEWQKTYGGSENDEASFIQQTVDGGYIVTGSTESYGAGFGDFLILKLFSNGDSNSSCGFINDSNAEVSDTGFNPVDTDVDPENTNILSEDMDITPRESEAVVYSLCSGPRTLSLSSSTGGTTNPQPGTYIYDYAERITLGIYQELGYNFIGWSGDVLSTDKLVTIVMDSDKSMKANFSEIILDEMWEEVKKAPCFIATAAFGSPLHPFVITLQDFRDRYLMSSRAGRKLVNLYYKYSPHIAELITNHKVLKTVVRIWLMPIVAVGYSMVHFGPVQTSLMLILTNIPIFFFVWFYRRRGKRDKP